MQLSHELFLSVWLWMGRHSVKIGDQRTLSTTMNSYSKSASLIYIFINLWRGAIETEISLFFRAMNFSKANNAQLNGKKAEQQQQHKRKYAYLVQRPPNYVQTIPNTEYAQAYKANKSIFQLLFADQTSYSTHD